LVVGGGEKTHVIHSSNSKKMGSRPLQNTNENLVSPVYDLNDVPKWDTIKQDFPGGEESRKRENSGGGRGPPTGETIHLGEGLSP